MFKAKAGEEAEKPNFVKGGKSWFTEEDADLAIKQIASDKALGPDGLGINLFLDLNNPELRNRACKELTEIANSGNIPDFFKMSRRCYLSKDKSSEANLKISD